VEAAREVEAEVEADPMTAEVGQMTALRELFYESTTEVLVLQDAWIQRKKSFFTPTTSKTATLTFEDFDPMTGLSSPLFPATKSQAKKKQRRCGFATPILLTPGRK